MRFLLADDHQLTRIGARFLIESKPEWRVCAEADSGELAIAMVKEFNPDVVILDLCMNGKNGVEVTKEIRAISPRTKIIFFTMHDIPALAMQAGADGFVCKSRAASELITTIERVLGVPLKMAAQA